MMDYPSAELVMGSWLKTLPAMTNINVSTIRPDPPTWTTDLFVTVAVITPTSFGPNHTIDMQVDVFARPATTNSTKPQWNLASDLAEQIAHASMTQRVPGRMSISYPGSFYDVHIKNIRLTQFPRQIQGTPNSLARYELEVLMGYSTLVPVSI